jgi:Fe-S-cluster containining protein
MAHAESMRLSDRFSYRCGRCGLCCRNKVISLSSYDLFRMAKAAGISTEEAKSRFTIRRGSLLKFDDNGGCVALRDGLCSIHQGRPLACRLYPLGMERSSDGFSFRQLEPEIGSAGEYGIEGTVDNFLEAQETRPYMEALPRYEALLATLRVRAAELAIRDDVEPREFRRVAIREALAESCYDQNPLIDTLYSIDGDHPDDHVTIDGHCASIADLANKQDSSETVAAAAVFLAISIGFTPAEAFLSL